MTESTAKTVPDLNIGSGESDLPSNSISPSYEFLDEGIALIDIEILLRKNNEEISNRLKRVQDITGDLAQWTVEAQTEYETAKDAYLHALRAFAPEDDIAQLKKTSDDAQEKCRKSAAAQADGLALTKTMFELVKADMDRNKKIKRYHSLLLLYALSRYKILDTIGKETYSMAGLFHDLREKPEETIAHIHSIVGPDPSEEVLKASFGLEEGTRKEDIAKSLRATLNREVFYTGLYRPGAVDREEQASLLELSDDKDREIYKSILSFIGSPGAGSNP